MILILKVDNPPTFKEFRPINLCNVICKLVSKVFVDHLKVMLSEITRRIQSSFILGRSAIDNAIILPKFISRKCMSKKKQAMLIISLILRKPVTQWINIFPCDTIQYFEFPSRIFSLVLSNISFTYFSLLRNKSRIEHFQPLYTLQEKYNLYPYTFSFFAWKYLKI